MMRRWLSRGRQREGRKPTGRAVANGARSARCCLLPCPWEPVYRAEECDVWAGAGLCRG